MIAIGTTNADSSSMKTGCGVDTVSTNVVGSGADIALTGARVTFASPMRL